MINKKNLILLNHLREDSRIALSVISRSTNIPTSTLYDLLRELRSGLIVKSTVLLDYAKLGLHTRTQVVLRVESGDKERLIKHLFFHSQVNNVYKTTGSWDLIIETVHKNNKEFASFLEDLSRKYKVTDKQVLFLVEEVKKEGFTLNSNLLPQKH